MSKKISKVLLKDIVIPAGTILNTAPIKTTKHGDCHFDCVVGLSNNTFGFFSYCIDGDEKIKS